MNHPKSLRVQGLSRLRPRPEGRFRVPSPPNPMLEKRLPCAHSVHAGAAAVQQLPPLEWHYSTDLLFSPACADLPLDETPESAF